MFLQTGRRTRRRAPHLAMLALSTLLTTALCVGGCGRDASLFAPDLQLDETPSEFSAGGDNRTGVVSGLLRLVRQLVLPTVGGLLQLDRFTLEIPPGALPQPTIYTLRSLGDPGLTVELGPHGAQFEEAVTLSIDLRGTSLAGRPEGSVGLFWYDEQARRWIDVGGSWDPATGRLTTDLEHFSRYRPGPRAGW